MFIAPVCWRLADFPGRAASVNLKPIMSASFYELLGSEMRSARERFIGLYPAQALGHKLPHVKDA